MGDDNTFDPFGYVSQKYQAAKDYIAQDPELSTYADLAKTGWQGLKGAVDTGITAFKATSPAGYAFSQAGNPSPKADLLGQVAHVPGVGSAGVIPGPWGPVAGMAEESGQAAEEAQNIIPGPWEPREVETPEPVDPLHERTGDPQTIKSLEARYFGRTKAENLMRKTSRQLIKDGHNEPYYGAPVERPVWRDTEADPKAESLLHPLPARTDEADLEGVLGKGVPDATGADPFSWMESKYGATKKTLQNNFETPLQIHTRSDLIARDDYMPLLNPDKHEINMHFADPSDYSTGIGRLIEPGAPSFQRRLEAAKHLQENGFKVNLVQDNLIGAPEHIPLPPAGELQVRRIQAKTGLPVKENNVKLSKGAIQRLKEAFGTGEE